MFDNLKWQKRKKKLLYLDIFKLLKKNSWSYRQNIDIHKSKNKK